MLLPLTWPPPASHVEMWWDSNKEYLKIVNSSNHGKGLGWAAGRRRRNLAWIWISQHLNGTSRKRCPCAKWPLEQVWFTKSALLNVDGNVEKSLRNILPIFPLLCTYILVDYRVIAKYSIKLSNIWYHLQFSFRFCETCFLHIKPVGSTRVRFFHSWVCLIMVQ